MKNLFISFEVHVSSQLNPTNIFKNSRCIDIRNSKVKDMASVLQNHTVDYVWAAIPITIAKSSE